MGIDPVVQLACRRGISYQATSRLLASPPGNISGRAARPGTPRHPAPPPGDVNPAPAAAPGRVADVSTGKGASAVVTRLRPPAAPSPAGGPLSGPPVILALPPAPKPAAAPERPDRAAEQAAIETWLAANPVRREPDYGDVQAEYRIFKRDGRWVGRDGKSYLVDNWRLSKADFKAQARKLAKDRGWPWPEDC